MVERSLSMREARGSIPRSSKYSFFFLFFFLAVPNLKLNKKLAILEIPSKDRSFLSKVFFDQSGSTPIQDFLQVPSLQPSGQFNLNVVCKLGASRFYCGCRSRSLPGTFFFPLLTLDTFFPLKANKNKILKQN